MSGLSGLLNLTAANHTTVVVTDSRMEPVIAAVQQALRDASTRVVILSLDPAPDSPEELLGELRRWGIDPARDYVSFLTLVTQHEAFDAIRAVQSKIARGDCARLELPSREVGYRPEYAAEMMEVVLSADYQQQDLASGIFFEFLGTRRPYEVEIKTGQACLKIADTAPWFQLAGRLGDGESRILPGGEVAYTGSRIEGTFRVSSGLLATPQRPAAAPLARDLTFWSRHLSAHPVELEIRGGVVERVRGEGGPAAALRALLEHPPYRTLTEVGLSFNAACHTLIHDWPAASNEGHPGVHIGLGGDPDPEDLTPGPPLVHLDLISRETTVTVNSHRFLALQ